MCVERYWLDKLTSVYLLWNFDFYIVLFVLNNIYVNTVVLPKVYPGFDLTTHDSDFTILVEVFMNRISAENTYFTNHTEGTNHKIMAFKPANRYQIIRQSLLSMISIIISLSSKSYVNIFFMVPNIMNCKDGTVNHSNI